MKTLMRRIQDMRHDLSNGRQQIQFTVDIMGKMEGGSPETLDRAEAILANLDWDLKALELYVTQMDESQVTSTLV